MCVNCMHERACFQMIQKTGVRDEISGNKSLNFYVDKFEIQKHFGTHK